MEHYTEQAAGRKVTAASEGTSRPPNLSASANLSSAGVGGCPGAVSGAGEERAAGLGDGHLPKDLELGVGRSPVPRVFP